MYGNKYEDTRDHVDMTLRPHMAGIAGQCRIKLLPLERQARTVFKHNTDDLLQMSPKEQFEAYGTGIEKTCITSNEARAKLGYPPLEGGDELRSPHVQSSKSAAPPAKPGKKADKPAPDDTADEAYARLEAEHRELVNRNLADVVAVIGEQAARWPRPGSFCAGRRRSCPAGVPTFSRPACRKPGRGRRTGL